jgi:hypothetical protein
VKLPVGGKPVVILVLQLLSSTMMGLALRQALLELLWGPKQALRVTVEVVLMGAVELTK